MTLAFWFPFVWLLGLSIISTFVKKIRKLLPVIKTHTVKCFCCCLGSFCCCSVIQLCLTLCDPMDCSMSGVPVLHYLLEFAKTHAIELMMSSKHLILCHPLLMPSISSSIRVFSKELTLLIRWPKYWNFSISPSSEYSGFISFQIDWFDLFAVQRTHKSLL